MEEKRATLGQVLRAARHKKGVPLREVEKATKISNAYLHQLETDTVAQPSPHKLYALSEFLGIDYSMLMELAGYVVPAKRKASTSSEDTLLLTGERLTEDETAVLKDFLKEYREFRKDSRLGKDSSNHK